MVRSRHKHRTLSLHDPTYAAFVDLLVDLRKESGLKQRHVADALGWHQSVVSKIERKQRRIDIVEFVRFAEVLGIEPAVVVKKVQKMLQSEAIG